MRMETKVSFFIEEISLDPALGVGLVSLYVMVPP